MKHEPGKEKTKEIILLDGGTGGELRSRGVNLSDNIWSATGLVDAPDVVIDIHTDYIQAGADVITTNTYGVIKENLELDGIGDRFEDLLVLACQLARKARDASGRGDVLVAGSIPPLKGSYRPDLVGGVEEMLSVYGQHIRIMSPFVDMFLCETMSSVKEGYAAAKAASVSGRPVWVAWTLHEDRSGRLRSGETLSEACLSLENLPVSGTLVNCCAPESVEAAMGTLKSKGREFIGGYANTFTPIPEDWVLGQKKDEEFCTPFRKDLSPEEYLKHVKRWIYEGANVVGGCCGTGPEHIRKIRKILDNRQG